MVELKRTIQKEMISISNEPDNQKTTKDRIFKKIFGVKELFLMFVQDFIKEDWVKQLSIEDLEIMPVKFLNLRDGDRESDILYRVNLKDEEIFVFIHLEHQAKVNFLMPFRVIEYMTRIWRNWIDEQDEPAGAEKPSERKGFLLPPIYPVVFYDGKSDWTAELEFAKKVKDYQRFEKYIPKFSYSVISLDKIGLNKLDKLMTPEVFEQLDWQEFEEKIKEKLNTNKVIEVINEATTLLLENINVPEEEIGKIKAHISEGRLEQMFEMLVDYDVQKVRREERIEVARNLLKEGMDIPFIIKITGLPDNEVKKLMEDDHYCQYKNPAEI
jgi:predicted transposase/invertase (TIGR01784 family)